MDLCKDAKPCTTAVGVASVGSDCSSIADNLTLLDGRSSSPIA
jgi:hypothetical protein